MRVLKLVAAAAALTAALPATAATTINFDTLPNGATVPIMSSLGAQYASLGVTFTGSNSGVASSGTPTATDYSAGPVNEFYNRNYLANTDLPSSYNFTLVATRYDLMSWNFAVPVSDIAFSLNTFGGASSTATFKAYDAAGTLLQTAVFSANDGWQQRTLTASGVSRVDVTSGLHPNGSIRIYGIDQLIFTPVAGVVPEPASWALMIGGFGMAGGALRRRKPRVTVRFA